MWQCTASRRCLQCVVCGLGLCCLGGVCTLAIWLLSSYPYAISITWWPLLWVVVLRHWFALGTTMYITSVVNAMFKKYTYITWNKHKIGYLSSGRKGSCPCKGSCPSCKGSCPSCKGSCPYCSDTILSWLSWGKIPCNHVVVLETDVLETDVVIIVVVSRGGRGGRRGRLITYISWFHITTKSHTSSCDCS